MAVTDASDALISLAPTKELDARKTFGIDLDWKIPAFAEKSGYVPDFDPAYRSTRRPRGRSSRASSTTAA